MANEKLSYEIAALYTGNAAIKQAFDDFAKLNAQGARVTNELNKLAKQSQQTGEALRNSRQGTAQLGMQFNQFATQVASGTSPLLAMQQQLGDVGYAMSFMGGAAGRVGGFLAGPWGAAIIMATSILTPLAMNLLNNGDASDKMADALDKNEEAARSVAEAMRTLNSLHEDYALMVAGSLKAERALRKSYADTARQALAAAELQMLAAEQIVSAEIAKLKAMEASNLKMIESVARAGGEYATLGAVVGAGNQEQKQANRIAAQTAAANQALADVMQRRATLQKRINDLTRIDNQIAGESLSGGSPRAERSSGKTNAERAAGQAERDRQRELATYQSMAERLRSIVTLRTADTEAIGRAKNELAEFDKLLADISAISVDGQPIGARLLGQMDSQIALVRKELEAATLDLGEYMVAIPPMAAAAEEAFKRQREAIESVGESVSNAFKGMLTAGASWKDGMRGIIQTVIDELWRLFVVQQIVGMVTSAVGGIFGGGLGKSDPLAKAFDATFGGGKAIGGSVYSNKAYLVGERGPEMFVPGSSGAIIPNHKTANMGGGGKVVVNVDARGSADPAAVRAQVQQGILEAAPAIIAAAESRTVQNMRRPRLGGVMQ